MIITEGTIIPFKVPLGGTINSISHSSFVLLVNVSDKPLEI